MNAKNLWTGFVRSPTSMKLLTIMVILIWLIPFVMIVAGLIFFLERPGAALEATPGAAMPTITLEPPNGPVGTVVKVHGEGWPAGSLVSIHLINQSTRHDICEWNFGDGQTSTEHNPVHTYTAAGDYTVRLKVKESGVWSNYRTKTDFIVVTELPPLAAFSANPISGTAPLNVQFSDQSSDVITAWSWDFGDGSTSTLQNPTHTYVAAGNYSVSLTASGPGGSDTKTKDRPITVKESPAPLRVPEIPTPTLEPPPPTPEPPTPTPEPPTPTPEPPTPTPEPPTPAPVPPPPESPTPLPTDTPTPLPILTPLPADEPVNAMLPTDSSVQ